jgi:hypothetical protein
VPVPLWFRFRVPRTPLPVRVRRGAPDACGGHPSGLGQLISRCPGCRSVPFVDASGISQVAWRSIPCLCPAPRPRPSQQVLASWRTCRCCPRSQQTEGPSGHMISRLTTRLQHLPPTLHEQRHRCPCKAGFRLAGCAFTGRGSNPLDRFERFRVTSFLLSRPLPDASWVHAERLIHKLDAFTEQQRVAQKRVRSLIWRFYADLKAYRLNPTPRRRGQLRARFDRIFCRRTGFVTLDRLLARLQSR